MIGIKYKVGDEVIIRDDLVGDTHYHDMYFPRQMAQYRGRKAKIVSIFNEKEEKYRIDLDKQLWIWSSEMFETPFVALPTKEGVLGFL